MWKKYGSNLLLTQTISNKALKVKIYRSLFTYFNIVTFSWLPTLFLDFYHIFQVAGMTKRWQSSAAIWMKYGRDTNQILLFLLQPLGIFFTLQFLHLKSLSQQCRITFSLHRTTSQNLEKRLIVHLPHLTHDSGKVYLMTSSMPHHSQYFVKKLKTYLFRQ